MDFQPLHGSPYHVYPINNHPPVVQAFQAPNTASLYNVSTSPLLTNKLQKMVSTSIQSIPFIRFQLFLNRLVA